MSFSKKHTGFAACGAVARGAVAAGLALSLVLGGCASASAGSGSSSASTASATVSATTIETLASGNAVELVDASTLFSTRDLDPSYDDVTATIKLSDDGCAVDGSGVSVEGSTVTITAEGVYVVSGTLTDGRIVVDAPEDAKVQLVLDGASVTSSGAAALYVREADKVFITLADGSSNSLASTGEAEALDDHNVDGTVFSTSDLTVNGAGALSVTSAQGHGIVGKDELTLVSGEVTVEAAGHAVQGKDSVAVAGGTWTLTGGTDGVHCDNEDDESLGFIYIAGGELNITAASDGLDASGVLQIDGGALTVDAGDDGVHAEFDVAVNGGTVTVSQSYEALEGSTVSITGGTLNLTASDDGINAAGEPDGSDEGSDADGTSWMSMMGGGMDENDATASVTITGGTTVIDAGGDGIDSNGDLVISGGETYVSGPTQDGDGALDYAGEGTISGGVLVAAGSAGMAQNLGSTSTQGCLLLAASGSAGDEVSLVDADGTVLASFAPTKSYACVLISAPGIEAGTTYTLSCGSSSSEVTPDSLVYSNVTGGMGQMGGAQAPGGDMGGQAPTGDGQAPGGDMGGQAPSDGGQAPAEGGQAPGGQA